MDPSNIESIENSLESKTVDQSAFQDARKNIFDYILQNQFSKFVESEDYLTALKYLKFGGKNRSELEQVILSVSGAKIFMTYCKGKFCHNDLSFWLECEAFLYLPTSANRSQAAKLIFDTYLKENTAFAVNIGHDERNSIKSQLEDPPHDLFVEFSNLVLDSLYEGAWKSFKQDPSYSNFARHGTQSILEKNLTNIPVRH